MKGGTVRNGWPCALPEGRPCFFFVPVCPFEGTHGEKEAGNTPFLARRFFFLAGEEKLVGMCSAFGFFGGGAYRQPFTPVSPFLPCMNKGIA